MTSFVKARVTVPGIHNWPDAPDFYRPLKSPHRHLFTFEVEVAGVVSRQVEFIDAARRVELFLDEKFTRSRHWGAYDFGEHSCEQLAQLVADAFPEVRRVTVWEDMENAGGVERD